MSLSSFLEPGAIVIGPWKESEYGAHETCEIATSNIHGEVQSLVVTAFPSYSVQERAAEVMWAIQELQNWFNDAPYDT